MIIGIVIIVVTTGLAALLRFGVGSMSRTTRADAIRDAAEEVPGAYRVASLLEDRELIVPAVSVIHALLMVLAAVVGAWALSRNLAGTSLALALAAMTVLLVLIGDMVPRTFGRRRPRTVAYRLSPLVALAVRVGAWATDILTDDEEEQEDEDGDNHEGENRLITSVLEFSETIVREVMVPRTDMIVVGAEADFDELLEIFSEHGFTRIPVVGDGPDDVLGLLIVKDFLPVLAAGARPVLTSIMRPIDFVPETKRIPDLLREMQASKSHMAVVVDEYGGTAGIVTIEDLLEELVGEIVDEYDDEELLVEERDGSWLVDGRLDVEELSELVDSELPDEEWDTVGGLVLGLAGRVPLEGERFEVGDVSISVLKVQGRRVQRVEVRRLTLITEDAG